ncbi:MAG: hypothetical protein NAOJABEB_02363 [Steroidobacteraceae bacterium]|nr:hypothetical protein [Steroidobacteraceae bacterium]
MSNERSERLAAIGELPRDVPPARNLWPGIAAAIEGSSAAPASRWGRAVPRPVWALAAAVACVAVGVWVGRLSAPATSPVAAVGSRPESARMAERVIYDPGIRFERTREHLLREVGARLAQLPPGTRARVEASLETVQRARRDIEQALGRDPGNALLQEMLVNSYQDEMRVLATVREPWVSGQEIGT